MNLHHRWIPPLLGLALIGGSCKARESRLAVAESELEDLRLAVKARSLLNRNAVLAPMNLGVNVRGGVATLWGPIPSEGHLRQAVHLLQGLTGIHQVRTDVYLASRDGVSGGRVRLPEVTSPTRSASASLAWTGGGHLLPSLTVARPDTPAGPGSLDPGHPHASPSRVALLAPIPFPQQLPEREPNDRPARDPLLTALDGLLQSDRRYRHMQIDVRQGVVSIHSGGTAAGLVMAFALEARRLPGIRRVILRQDRGY